MMNQVAKLRGTIKWHYVNSAVILMTKIETTICFHLGKHVEKVINPISIITGMEILKRIMTWASMSAYAKFVLTLITAEGKIAWKDDKNPFDVTV